MTFVVLKPIVMWTLLTGNDNLGQVKGSVTGLQV